MRQMYSLEEIMALINKTIAVPTTFEVVLAQVPGYDPEKLQVLKNGYGTFMWVEEEDNNGE